LAKCGPEEDLRSGTLLLNMVDALAGLIPECKTITLQDASTVSRCSYPINLADLTILLTGISWYNRLGYKQSSYESDKEYKEDIFESVNEKGQLFYPTHLSEIQPKEFLKAKKLARPITLSEFEIDPDEWKKLCQENEGVRFLEGGKKLLSMPISFYDKDIFSLLTKNAQKLPSALAHIISKMKIKTGDAFIVSRLKVMAEIGKIVFAGNWQKGWKDIVVQMPGGSTVVVEE
jgi:hypothetical protein